MTRFSKLIIVLIGVLCLAHSAFASGLGFDVRKKQPQTTKGDLATHNGTTFVRLPVGSNGQILSADSSTSSGLSWVTNTVTPINADYLVGTTNGVLTNEIVVGTSPGGELGGTWASPTIDDSLAVTSWNLTTPTLTTSTTVSDAHTLGLGAGKGLIQFDDEATDFLSFSNCNVGIGTTGPGALVDIVGTSQTVLMQRVYTDSVAADTGFRQIRYRNTIASPQIVQNNDILAQWTGFGYDGTDTEPGGTIRIVVNGTPGNDDMPGAIIFGTTADGAKATTDRMIINSSGNVGIGTTTPATTLEVVGTMSADQVSVDAVGLMEATNVVGLRAPALSSDSTYYLPATIAGSSGQVLHTDTSGNMYWADDQGGTPSGSNTQIQFNDSGAFGGDISLVFDKQANTFSVDSVTVQSSDPALVILNTDADDSGNGRESFINFKGVTAAGITHTLSRIRVEHPDASNDEEGLIMFYNNDGNDGLEPSALSVTMGENASVANAQCLFVNSLVSCINDTNTYLQFNAADEAYFVSGAVQMWAAKEGVDDYFTINDGNVDIDFTVEGNDDATLIRTDAVLNTVAMGQEPTDALLTVDGTFTADVVAVTDGTNFTALQSGDVSSDTTYYLPMALPGVAGLKLTSATNGVLTWTPDQTGGGGADDYEFVSITSVTAAATVDITGIASGYDYIFVLNNVIPATDGDALAVRTSTDGGSTFAASADNYEWQGTCSNGTGVGGGTTGGDSEMEVTGAGCGTVGSAANEDISGEIRLFNPGGVTWARITGILNYTTSAGWPANTFSNGTRRDAADVDAIRFFWTSAGNFEAAGTISVYRRIRS